MKNSNGFTIIEGMIALVIFTVITTSLSGLYQYGVKKHSYHIKREQGRLLLSDYLEWIKLTHLSDGEHSELKPAFERVVRGDTLYMISTLFSDTYDNEKMRVTIQLNDDTLYKLVTIPPKMEEF